MPAEGKGRQMRTPKTQEEIAELLLWRKIRDFNNTENFKKTLYCKWANIFNVVCFFVYIEILVCFMGPCRYENHYCINVKADFGNGSKGEGSVLKDVILTGMDGKKFEFVVNEKTDPPPNYSLFSIGKEFLLGKEMKGSYFGSDKTYRIYSSGSVVFLCSFAGLICLILFIFNMNLNPHSLRTLTILNLLTIAGCFFF